MTTSSVLFGEMTILIGVVFGDVTILGGDAPVAGNPEGGPRAGAGAAG